MNHKYSLCSASVDRIREVAKTMSRLIQEQGEEHALRSVWHFCTEMTDVHVFKRQAQHFRLLKISYKIVTNISKSILTN